ncbi:hypothetical protein LguiB_031392 [Lonicera macranthoides]
MAGKLVWRFGPTISVEFESKLSESFIIEAEAKRRNGGTNYSAHCFCCLMLLCFIASIRQDPYSPYATAPSSSQCFDTNYFFSGPTSPVPSSSSFHHLSTPSEIPFNWEEKPDIAKITISPNELSDTYFVFNFSGQLERPSLSAGDLFDEGKIKP